MLLFEHHFGVQFISQEGVAHVSSEGLFREAGGVRQNGAQARQKYPVEIEIGTNPGCLCAMAYKMDQVVYDLKGQNDSYKSGIYGLKIV